MEDIRTRTKDGRNRHKAPIDNKTNGNPFWKEKDNKPQDRAPLECHECGSTSHLANTCPKQKRINDMELKKSQDNKKMHDVSVHESYSKHSEQEELPEEISIEKVYVSFELTEIHTHFPQHSDEFMDSIQVKNAKIQKANPFRGNIHTAGTSSITNIVINNK
ncbi:hypothetical protein O181_002863 [Austropuccinia psidii MF-1]|uniref:CCHC-type domain-containing protein n=1 Tax=Austropuccinia psidii MF-1 TaxID=1389203 RepID=A0A9Q3GD10_9BASI|nr:hypothetical protein [Austropuccinia psidii MF-1]